MPELESPFSAVNFISVKGIAISGRALPKGGPVVTIEVGIALVVLGLVLFIWLIGRAG